MYTNEVTDVEIQVGDKVRKLSFFGSIIGRYVSLTQKNCLLIFPFEGQKDFQQLAVMELRKLAMARGCENLGNVRYMGWTIIYQDVEYSNIRWKIGLDNFQSQGSIILRFSLSCQRRLKYVWVLSPFHQCRTFPDYLNIKQERARRISCLSSRYYF